VVGGRWSVSAIFDGIKYVREGRVGPHLTCLIWQQSSSKTSNRFSGVSGIFLLFLLLFLLFFLALLHIRGSIT